ncbi:MAG: hypothetical protein IJC43_07745, partial [Clostridia bacterium]|nr:hypothetical protein [Clostridia bacterium]
MSQHNAVLLLSDGRRFAGRALGAKGLAVGEAVFHTGQVLTHPLLTTPASLGQILCFPSPIHGNSGINPADAEGAQVYAAGLVVRECSATPSNFRSEEDLPSWLERQGVVAIEGIDTRALTRHLRTAGPLRAAIVSDGRDEAEVLALLGEPAAPLAAPRCELRMTNPTDASVRVAILDLGCSKTTVDALTARGAAVTLLAPDCGIEAVADFDGVLLSDGPELPFGESALKLAADLLASPLPLLAVDAGHLLLAEAAGMTRTPLPVPHRGNQPVAGSEGHTFTSLQHHAFAVDAGSVDAAV